MLKKLFSFARNQKTNTDSGNSHKVKTPPQKVNYSALDETNPKHRRQLLECLSSTTDNQVISEISSRLNDKQQLISDFIAQPESMLARLIAAKINREDIDNTMWEKLITLPHSLPLQQLFISQCDDQAQLQTLANVGHSHAIRQQACSKITDTERLTALLSSIGKRDKKVRQFIKQSLNKQRQVALEQQQTQNAISELTAQTQRFASQAWNPQLSGKLHILKQQRDKLLPHLDDAQQTAIEQHLTQIGVTVASHEAELKAQAKAAELKQQQIALSNELKQLLTRLATTYSEQQSDELSAIIDTAGTLCAGNPNVEAQLRQLTELHQAHLRFQQAQSDLIAYNNSQAIAPQQRANLITLLATINWPATSAKPALLADLDKRLHTAAATPKVEPGDSQALKQQRQALKQQLIDCELAVDAKDLNTTNKISSEIRHILQKTAVADRDISSHWQRLSKRVFELRDWHKFASMTQRQQLCNDMKALTDDVTDLNQRAATIKQLQADWKALGSDFSAESKALWNEFKKAADIAYLPCKAHFAEAQNQRQRNSEKRQQLCEQLKHYLTNNDWASTRFDAIDTILQQAKQEWRGYFPVEKNTSNALQQRFNGLLKDLNNNRQASLDILIEEKQQFISQAQQLLQQAETDLTGAINQAKSIQQRWQQCEKLPHAIDKKLWHELRSHLDVLFEQRQAQKQQREKDQLVHVNAANLIIEQIEQLSKLDDASLKQSRPQYNALCHDYHNVGDRPNTAYKQQQTAFKKACDDYTEHFDSLHSRAERQQWADFITLCQLLNQRDLCSDDEQRHTLQHTIEQQWQTLDCNSHWKQAVSQRIASASKCENVDEQQYRHLCIELELAAGIDSPAQDQAQRMALQMNKLKQGLGQGSSDQQALILQWLSLPACSDATLQQRVDNIVQG